MGLRYGGEGSRANMGENLRCGGCLQVLFASDMNVTLQEVSLLTHQQCALYLSPATMKLLQQVQKTIRDRWLLLTDTGQNPVDYPSHMCMACMHRHRFATVTTLIMALPFSGAGLQF